MYLVNFVMRPPGPALRHPSAPSLSSHSHNPMSLPAPVHPHSCPIRYSVVLNRINLFTSGIATDSWPENSEERVAAAVEI
jgi:hypothetical protein